jgi:hypothetical protein
MSGDIDPQRHEAIAPDFEIEDRRHPMTHPIPKQALDDRLAFVGTAGSGKTYNAGSCVERLLSAKARAVVIDPLGVWWGLRLKSDGETESPFNIPIFWACTETSP